jgi:hypothetical protein
MIDNPRPTFYKGLMRSVLGVVSALGLLARAAQPLQAAVILDDTAGWNHFNGIELFGNGNYVTPSFGQSFTAPAGVNALTSFTFWLDDELNASPVHFAAYLVQWNGSAGTGPLLYSSPVQITTDNHGGHGMETFQFSFPPVNVLPGSQYMAFLSTLGVSQGLTGAAYTGNVGGDVLPGGRAYVNYILTTVADSVGSGWAFLQPSVDVAFRAEFVLVPEPTALPWLGLGAFAWSVRCRRMQRRER